MANEKALRTAAKELNEVLGLDPVINVKANVTVITGKIKEAITDLITDDDEFSDATQAVLDELKAEMEEVEETEDEEEVEETEDEQEEEEVEEEEEVKPAKGKGKPEKPAGEKRPAPPKKLASGYTRTDAVCEALAKGKPKTNADWVSKANALIVKQGGKANDSENKAIMKLVRIMINHLAPGVKTPTA